jgi:DNA (cytosine-5)-methyltransferase 1
VNALKAQAGETGKGDAAPMVLQPTPTPYVKRHGANTPDDHEIWEEGQEARTLNAMGQAGTNGALAVDPQPVAFEQNQRDEVRETPQAGTLQAQQGSKMETRVIPPAGAVRRLTPTECERLQGFPNGWTAIPEER